MSQIHQHILVTGYLDKAPEIDYTEFLDGWFNRLVAAVDMEILIPPKCIWCDEEGNEGVTGLVCITTSHSSIHFWSEPRPFYKFDLYSCKDYAVDIVVEMLKELGTKELHYDLVDRNGHKAIIIESGHLFYD